jgi:type I restriction enzyme S subunit
MDPDFLFFLQWSDHVMPKAKTMVSGSTPSRQRVDPTSFYKIRVPLPPLPEQRRIAHVLSTVQEAIAQQEKLIRTTTELKQALMQKLFTEGLRGEPLKETEIGMVPESWGIVSVGQLFYTQLGKMLSPKARTGSEPKPYLRNKNVQWDGIDTDDLYLMDFDDREMEKFRLEPGDLLVCEGGEVGRTALWRGAIEECYYQKALHRLRPRDGSIRPAFMAYWMRYAFQMHNIYGVTGTRTTIAHLPEIKLTPLTVPLPSIEEQDKMLAVLEGTDEKLDHTRHKLIALQALFRTLLHELMTGKVSVGEMN